MFPCPVMRGFLQRDGGGKWLHTHTHTASAQLKPMFRMGMSAGFGLALALGAVALVIVLRTLDGGDKSRCCGKADESAPVASSVNQADAVGEAAST